MAPPSLAFFAMPQLGHFQCLRPLIREISRRGARAYVFTDRRFRDAVERAGGEFVDIFGAYPIESADRDSLPTPCRFVAFAAVFAGPVTEELARRGVDLVVYDTHAVIGRVAARRLAVPYVNVCAGHNLDPARSLRELRTDPLVSVSDACRRAVEVLRDREGLEDASPFAYVSGISPFLNVYNEPTQFLAEDERTPFEPIAFSSSLVPPDGAEQRPGRAPTLFPGGRSALRVYVSFGTIIWKYWRERALEALHTIADGLARTPRASGLLSLGGVLPATAARQLRRPNVAAAAQVDQWRALAEADAFITHHGINSTHEAIFNLTPMISYPFFADQPGLARRCQEFGLAQPLSDGVRGQISEESVALAVAELEDRRESLGARLSEAREWEREAIARQGEVAERVLDLIPG